MTGRLDGKVALVTGGASGIGAETARLFAREGAKVAVTDVNDNGGRGVVDEIDDVAFYTRLDTRSEDEWQAVVKQTADTYGRLDILVNAAGVPGRRSDGGSTKIDEQDLDDWNRVMDVNSTGIFLGMKTVIPEMRTAGGGSIVNISSIYGLVGSVHSAAYHASKGSVRLATKSAALQYAEENIRVNSVHPGMVTTGMNRDVNEDPVLSIPRLAKTPMGRFGQPIDIANGCLFLASDESGWMTGAELVIDGGYTVG
ncbi:MAG: cyclopentanol dehydrogenase [Rickettsiales bacterium]|jgi:cyclopentanol dehydrogenase|nr:cyclopentanol dehydrogenase [Rickettsiales bacterium]|tara:strand:- start:1795 stop:2559 length:765 start_codon:yes stop_codon:yes gene_type:complete